MFKLVINNKEKAYSKELSDNESHIFMGKKIGENVSGSTFGFKNYEFQITGGSDKDGFPMRSDLSGVARRKLLLSKGPGVKIDRKGMRLRKMIRGNLIAQDIKQINLKVVKEGDKKLEEVFGKAEENKE